MTSELIRLLQGFFGRFFQFQLELFFSSDLLRNLNVIRLIMPTLPPSFIRVLKFDRCLQVDSVGVQVHTNNICWGIIEVKVSGVHSDNERTRRIQNLSHRERTQRDVGTLPLERKDHLEEETDGWKCQTSSFFADYIEIYSKNTIDLTYRSLVQRAFNVPEEIHFIICNMALFHEYMTASYKCCRFLSCTFML